MRKFWLVGLLGLVGCNPDNPDEREDELQDAATYEGTTFDELQPVLDDGVYARLPQHEVSSARFARAGVDLFEKTVKDLFGNRHDAHPFYNRLLHPNGICLVGTWQITENTPYTGLFARDARALVIARASTAFSNTLRGEARAFAMGLKLFPTEDGNQRIKTVNLFTFDAMFGRRVDHWLDAQLTNEPPNGDPLDPRLLNEALVILRETLKTDVVSRRPLHPAAQWGLEDANAAITPTQLTLRPELAGQRVAEEDFRDEIAGLVGRGKLVYGIEVRGESTMPEKSQAGGTGRVIGRLEFHRAVASAGCDHRLRFHHVKNP